MVSRLRSSLRGSWSSAQIGLSTTGGIERHRCVALVRLSHPVDLSSGGSYQVWSRACSTRFLLS